VND
jgi:hypothetical protein